MKEITFEKAIDKLEKIVEELEKSEFSLDNSIKKFEEGIQLAGICKTKLDKAKEKVETITRDKKGNFLIKDFKLDE